VPAQAALLMDALELITRIQGGHAPFQDKRPLPATSEVFDSNRRRMAHCIDRPARVFLVARLRYSWHRMARTHPACRVPRERCALIEIGVVAAIGAAILMQRQSRGIQPLGKLIDFAVNGEPR